MRVKIHDEKAIAFTHVDGHRYPVEDGHIEALPRHEEGFEAAGRYGEAVRVLPTSFSFSRAPGVVSPCGFEALEAMRGRPCPRCGDIL